MAMRPVLGEQRVLEGGDGHGEKPAVSAGSIGETAHDQQWGYTPLGGIGTRRSVAP